MIGALSSVTNAVKGEAIAVSEAAYYGVIVWTVGRQRRCEVGMVVKRWCCSTHTGIVMSSCVQPCVHYGLVEAEWLCGIVCRLPVASQHLIGNRCP